MRVVIDVTIDEATESVTLSDPQPDGSMKEISLDLSSGSATVTYDLPPDSPLTDLDVLEFNNLNVGGQQ